MPEKLYRSEKDSVIAGVCGGIAEYFNIDSVIVRLVAVALALSGGVGVILYLLAIIIIPKKSEKEVKAVEVKEDDKENESSSVNISPEKRGSDRRIWLGVGITLLGIVLLLKQFFYWLDTRFVWPSLLILLGIILISKERRRRI